MLISEIFYSIQGEGELTGMPSVFIRTAGCNLRCRWCDTPYASWQPEGRSLSIEDILKEASQYPSRHAVLTGGEPMIARDIHQLAAGLKVNGFHITIETAGTVAPEGICCDLASLSPKFSNSTPSSAEAGSEWVRRHELTRWQPEVLRQWVTAFPFQIKLVVTDESDARESLSLLKSALPEVPNWKIQLMPEGREEATLASRAEWLVDFCKLTGCRFCQRLHISLFGNIKGT